ncbi:MAG: prepilin-type N-terminal cleavage/methylation domain-containing protein [Gammaproteobacteria bacterium]|nr:prepilin-type N-terminal cleavage/methylation domain-containing protein [Gammaproteobacteria bacterium]
MARLIPYYPMRGFTLLEMLIALAILLPIIQMNQMVK